MKSVVQALALLTPYDIDKGKVRVGPKKDGGYILVDDLAPDQTVLSYGIGRQYDFDRDMAARGHDVFMFDHTIQSVDDASERMHFTREGVAGTSNPAEKLYSIADHLVRKKIAGERLILKMDVEGAEFAALGGTPEGTLRRFEQITFEVHNLHRLEKPDYRQTFVAIFEKLNRHFTLFHVHANNNRGPNRFMFVSGIPVSPLLELSYVRTDTIRRSASRTLYPTPFDYPNRPRRDKLLWMFPFLPTPVTEMAFVACADRLDLLDEVRRLQVQRRAPGPAEPASDAEDGERLE